MAISGSPPQLVNCPTIPMFKVETVVLKENASVLKLKLILYVPAGTEISAPPGAPVPEGKVPPQLVAQSEFCLNFSIALEAKV